MKNTTDFLYKLAAELDPDYDTRVGVTEVHLDHTFDSASMRVKLEFYGKDVPKVYNRLTDILYADKKAN